MTGLPQTRASPATARSHGMRAPLVWGGAVVLVLLLAGVSLGTTLAARARTLDSGMVRLEQVGAALAEHVHRIVFGTDLMVAAVEKQLHDAGVQTAEAFRAYGATREMYELLSDRTLLSADLDVLTLVGADGVIVNTSRAWPTPRLDLSDRDYFMAVRDNPGLRIAVSEPVRSRITGQELIFLAHRVQAQDGRLLGAITVALSASRLNRLFDATLHGEAGSVALLRRDGKLLVLEPPAEEAVALHPRLLRFMQDTLARDERGTLHDATSGPGGAPELVALQAVRGYPLAIQVTQSESLVLAPWRRLAQLVALFTFGGSCLVLVLGYALVRQWRMQLGALESTRLRQMNQELEQRVAQRTADLLTAKEEADRANGAKSEFLSRMSHELRTPLNAILGFGQLLEIAPDFGRAQRDWVREINKGGRHLLELINDVLDLARVESGRFSVSPEPVALRPLVEECLMVVRAQAKARAVQLLEVPGSAEVHVRADRTRLKQVLLNLLSNAVKYNRPGGTVGLVCTHAGDTLRIGVTDTGDGLTPEQQARLFMPFERLDADQRQIEGTGIGLALSKRLVELMGGDIGVDSTPGTGSVFWFELPLAGAVDARAPAAPADSGAAAPDVQRRDVLCIEDNPANLRLIEGILARRPNIRLLGATAPGEGLELARRYRPGLILLDINLPDKDGYAVLQCLREHAATRDIPVLAISANAMPKDIERGKAAGFADYLTKPIDVNRLLAAIDRWLGP